jgi:hypothetical protein
MAEFAGSHLPVSKPRSSLATPSLDDKIEYMDGFGVPRRSETYTRRMILRGHEIKMPDDLVNMDGVGQDDEADNDKIRHHEAQELLNLEKEVEAKRKANAAFKHQCKTERQQWIDHADKRLVERLTVWYDGTTVPADADYVAVTEKHTQVSPSNKAKLFIDTDGNVRRKSQLQLLAKADGVSSPTPTGTEPTAELRPADTVSPPLAGAGASTAGAISS